MIKLTEFSEEHKFYYGTIIVMKFGSETKKYAMTSGLYTNHEFYMVDLHYNIGSVTIFQLKPNIEGHTAVNKQGIKNWAIEHIENLFLPECKEKYLKDLDSSIYIEQLEDYFN